ncbi:MAG TPA: hypothetical protein VME45_05560 [Stellaceae bacterium]|nr:hypothetical protein [Stellaceae bacterium]
MANTGLDRAGAIPFFFRRQEKRPIRAGESGPDWFERRDAHLKIHAAPVGNFHPPGFPVACQAALVEHELRSVAIEIGETLLGTIEDHGKPAEIAPKSQTFLEIGDRQFRDEPGPSEFRRGMRL